MNLEGGYPQRFMARGLSLTNLDLPESVLRTWLTLVSRHSGHGSRWLALRRKPLHPTKTLNLQLPFAEVPTKNMLYNSGVLD